MSNKARSILLTGGSGLLGSTLRRLDSSIVAPDLDELEMTDPVSLRTTIERYAPEIVIHAAALTRIADVRGALAETLRVNIVGTAEIAALAVEKRLRLIYLSTDYVYPDTPGPHREDEPLLPLNEYSWTKLGGECAVRLVPGSLIIRTSFGPPVYPYEVAAEDKLTSKLYVEEAARFILDLAVSDETGIINVGGAPTDMLLYAHQTRPETRPVRLADLPGPIPRDSTLAIERFKKFLHDRKARGE